MNWIEVGLAVLRRWYVFLVAFAVLGGLSYSIREVGSEFAVDVVMLTVAPGDRNAVMEAQNTRFQSPITLAVIEIEGSDYKAELLDEGLTDRYVIDATSEFPFIIISVRGTSYAQSGDTAERLSEDFPAAVDQVQADRGADAVTRTQVSTLRLEQAPPRPAGSTRALAGLMFASVMIAGGLAYAVDQHFASIRRFIKLLYRTTAPVVDREAVR